MGGMFDSDKSKDTKFEDDNSEIVNQENSYHFNFKDIKVYYPYSCRN